MNDARPRVDAAKHFPQTAALPLAERARCPGSPAGSSARRSSRSRARSAPCRPRAARSAISPWAISRPRNSACPRPSSGRSPARSPRARPTIRPRTGSSSCAAKCSASTSALLGLSYPLESVMIAGGSRPVIYATFKAILDPGEKVLYAVPSWNNNHYAFLSGARAVELVVGPESGFLPTAAAIAPLLPGVRLICANSPLNPCGTVMARDEVRALGELVVAENRRRAAAGERPVFIMWDQVYWMLTFGEARHHTPPELVPEAAAWTIFVDGISKAFAATGLRVGWARGAPLRDGPHAGHPRPHRRLGAAPRAGGHGPVPRRRRRDEDLPRDDDPRPARAPRPASRGIPGDGARRSAGGEPRSAGGDLPVRPLRPRREVPWRNAAPDERGDPPAPSRGGRLRRRAIPGVRSSRGDGWMRLSVGAASPSEIREGLARVRRLLATIS